jgi:hypothetical protein
MRCPLGVPQFSANDRKGGPATRLALDRDVAAHHLTEAFTDREAKPGAAVFACRSGRRLGELLEQLVHLLWGHANAGVRHCQRDPIAAVLSSLVRVNREGCHASQGSGNQGPPAGDRSRPKVGRVDRK